MPAAVVPSKPTMSLFVFALENTELALPRCLRIHSLAVRCLLVLQVPCALLPLDPWRWSFMSVPWFVITASPETDTALPFLFDETFIYHLWQVEKTAPWDCRHWSRKCFSATDSPGDLG